MGKTVQIATMKINLLNHSVQNLGNLLTIKWRNK